MSRKQSIIPSRKQSIPSRKQKIVSRKQSIEITPAPRRSARDGLVAGVIGTAVMTGAQTIYMKFTDAEASNAPAEVGKRIIKGLFEEDIPAGSETLLNNAMHVLYGTGWGFAYGVSRGRDSPRALRSGLTLGLVAWCASLVELPLMKLAPPVWKYEIETLAPDVGFHVLFGVATATAFKVVNRS